MICERCGTVFCDDNCDYPPDVPAPRRRFCSYTCKHKDAPARKRRKRQLNACAAQGKQRYADAAEARSAAGWFLLRYGRVLHPYRCPCGWWHLTKRALADFPHEHAADCL